MDKSILSSYVIYYQQLSLLRCRGASPTGNKKMDGVDQKSMKTNINRADCE